MNWTAVRKTPSPYVNKKNIQAISRLAVLFDNYFRIASVWGCLP